MSIIDKLIASIKFKKASKFIITRIDELNSDLEALSFGFEFVTNEYQDYINCFYLGGCLELKSDCEYSLALIEGKIKALHPATQEQEEAKKEIIQSHRSAKERFEKISSDFNENEFIEEYISNPISFS